MTSEERKQFLLSIEKDIIEIRRHLHKNPELSNAEVETTNKIAQALSTYGIESTRFQQSQGLYCDITGNGTSKKRILVRADIDALPIEDKKATAYSSSNKGVMHACGHDAHTSMAIAVAACLQQIKGALNHDVRILFQPAEELGLGAKSNIEEGILTDVACALAIHVDPRFPVGAVAIRGGGVNAAVSHFTAEFIGKKAHAARALIGRDTIAPATHFIQQCYSLVPQRISSIVPHLIYFGTIEGGTLVNIIADHTTIGGNLRSASSEVVDEMFEVVKRIGEGIATISGLTFKIERTSNIKAVVNNDFLAEIMAEVAIDELGAQNVIRDQGPSMGGEDFGEITSLVPGVLIRLGITKSGAEIHELHTPYFDVEESALIVGARVMSESVISCSRSEFLF